MSYGPPKLVTVVIASGASTSSDVNLGRAYSRLGVQIGTMSTGVNVQIQHSVDNGTTWKYAFHPPIASSTVGTPQFIISAGVGSGGGYVLFPNGTTLEHIRFVGTGVVSGGVSFVVVASD